MDNCLSLLNKFLPALVDCHSVDFPEFPTLELIDEDELQRRGPIFRHHEDDANSDAAWLLEAASDSCRLSIKFREDRSPSCLVEMLRRLAMNNKIRSVRRTPLKGYHLTWLFIANDFTSSADDMLYVRQTITHLLSLALKAETESVEFIKRRASNLV